MRCAQLPSWLEVPGLVHGFGQRPDRSKAREEERAYVEALGRHGDLLLLRQVHGTEIALAPWCEPPVADASVAEGPGWLLGIKTADCLPVLLVDQRRHRVAAAHAGWRGTAAGIVRKVVEWLADRGSPPEDLWVALGPCVGVCCYEVGAEVAERFKAGHGVFRPGPGGKHHLDLRGTNERQLLLAGVKPGAICHVRECTYCGHDRYCSYRRDGPGCGRMISYVGWSVRPGSTTNGQRAQ